MNRYDYVAGEKIDVYSIENTWDIHSGNTFFFKPGLMVTGQPASIVRIMSEPYRGNHFYNYNTQQNASQILVDAEHDYTDRPPTLFSGGKMFYSPIQVDLLLGWYNKQ